MAALHAAIQHMKQDVVLFVLGRQGVQAAVLTATFGPENPTSQFSPRATLLVAAFRTARPVRNRAGCILQQVRTFQSGL